ncbi:hypothetical protein MtrunA17_Chr3g0123931 [Medicago truncatula]|uniref:Uncharacterized protein n=1 Tax=Medicago truncatula TaxID=3880 RepID=G7J3Q9_MEDTR|nr:uncharacterized protein LOC11415027 [Medicago truncatula]AES72194.1 hypothetical protein MTR_3g087110 [Medicago truncatula]RHN69368.1 hypothetical protein MtrunA17_Chr3g0123931 [Medicago truncatula]
MVVSLEALAMAGTSSVEYGIDIEEWERNDLEQYPPPHLLAQEEDDKISINGAKGYTEGNKVYGLPSPTTSTHFLPNNNTKEHDVTFTNHGEKGNGTLETRRLKKCASSIKLMARALEMLISLSCVISTRDY